MSLASRRDVCADIVRQLSQDSLALMESLGGGIDTLRLCAALTGDPGMPAYISGLERRRDAAQRALDILAEYLTATHNIEEE